MERIGFGYSFGTEEKQGRKGRRSMGSRYPTKWHTHQTYCQRILMARQRNRLQQYLVRSQETAFRS